MIYLLLNDIKLAFSQNKTKGIQLNNSAKLKQLTTITINSDSLDTVDIDRSSGSVTGIAGRIYEIQNIVGSGAVTIDEQGKSAAIDA